MVMYTVSLHCTKYSAKVDFVRIGGREFGGREFGGREFGEMYIVDTTFQYSIYNIVV